MSFPKSQLHFEDNIDAGQLNFGVTASYKYKLANEGNQDMTVSFMNEDASLDIQPA